MRKILFVALACAPILARADSGSESFGGSIDLICANAAPGTALFTRCRELDNRPPGGGSGPGPAGRGQNLEQIPGQGRANARPQSDSQEYSDEIGDGWSIFASVDLGRLDRDVSENEAAFDGGSNRLTAGVNYQASPKWLLGFALNHSQDELDFSDSKGYSDLQMTGALLSANFSPNQRFNFDAYLGSFNGSSDNLREIAYTFSTLRGDPFSLNASAFSSPSLRRKVGGASASLQWNRSAWSGNIQLGMDQAKTNLDAYIETGGDGFALKVPEREIFSKTAYLGFSIARTYSVSWGVVVPSVRANVRKEFENPSRNLTVLLNEDVSKTPISFATSDPDTQWGEVGVGVSLVMSKGHQAFFEYRQRFSHSFLQERTLSLGWRKEF
jgi:outer membrane lipase/esterase